MAQETALPSDPRPGAPTDPPAVSLESLMSPTAATADDLSPQGQTEQQVVARATALSPEDKRKADEIARTIDFGQAAIDQTYAADAQRDMADFSDTVLAKVSSKDTGEAGQLLRELLTTVDDSSLSGIRKVPIIGNVVMKADQIRREYQKVAPQVDEIVGRLEQSQAQMISDIAMYDRLYERSVAQYRQLKIYVAAGEQALAAFHADQLPRLEREAQASGDPMAGQVLKDFKGKLDRFEKHLDDLDRVSVVALQSCPQIKILQSADQVIADKISTTVSLTIPMWKSQMVIALGLENQRRALDLQKNVDDVTNRLMRENAKALHQGAIDTEKANQRGVVDVDTLQEVNSELIATIKDTIQVQEEGRAQRAEAQQRMRQMETDLKEALLEQARRL